MKTLLEPYLNYWWLPVAEFLVTEHSVCERSYSVTCSTAAIFCYGRWWSFFSMLHKGTQFASVNKLPLMSWHWRYSDWVHSSLEEWVLRGSFWQWHRVVFDVHTFTLLCKWAGDSANRWDSLLENLALVLECPSDQAQSPYSGLWWGPQIFSFPSPLVHVWSSPSQNVTLCLKFLSCPLPN